MLNGQTAVILGASSGFGEAIALRFAQAGARVIVAARRAELLDALAARADGIAAPCDITEDAQLAALARTALDRTGRLDIAVNCAGYEQSTRIRDLTPQRLAAMTAVQFTGAIGFIRHMANAITAGGSLITLSSVTATLVGEGLAAYAGAKAGVEHVVRIAALEYGPQGVRVNALAPSLIETPMTATMFRVPGVVQAFVDETPLGRMGTIADVVEAALWLASDASSYVTGQVIRVDGGASLRRLPTRAQIAARAAAATT